MKRLATLGLVLAVLLSVVPLGNDALAAPPRDGVVNEGSPEYENVEAAADFMEAMGDKEEADNVRQWLKDKKIKVGDIADNGITDADGNITVDRDYINPASSQDKEGKNTSFNKSGMKDIDKFEWIAGLASILLHEKVHAHQPNWFKASSNLNDYNPLGGDNEAELEAWHAELQALDRWILKMKLAKEYEKAIRLISMKVQNIKELRKSGYGDDADYYYGEGDIQRLEKQSTELQGLLSQGKTMDDDALGQVRRVEDEKQRQVAEGVSRWRKEGQAFAEGRALSVGLGQLPTGPAATISNLVVGKVVNIGLVLDRTSADKEVFTFNAKFRQDGGGLTLEMRSGSSPDPSLSLNGRESTLRSIMKATDPVGALLLALRSGDFTYSGSLAFPLKLALGVSSQAKGSFEVAQGQTKTVQYEGQPCTLQRNALGSRTVTLPGGKQVVAVDRYGGAVSYSTTAVQRLVATSPEGLSPSAGLTTKPVADLQQRGCPSCASAMASLQSAVLRAQANGLRGVISEMGSLDTTTRFAISRLR